MRRSRGVPARTLLVASLGIVLLAVVGFLSGLSYVKIMTKTAEAGRSAPLMHSTARSAELKEGRNINIPNTKLTPTPTAQPAAASSAGGDESQSDSTSGQTEAKEAEAAKKPTGVPAEPPTKRGRFSALAVTDIAFLPRSYDVLGINNGREPRFKKQALEFPPYLAPWKGEAHTTGPPGGGVGAVEKGDSSDSKRAEEGSGVGQGVVAAKGGAGGVESRRDDGSSGSGSDEREVGKEAAGASGSDGSDGSKAEAAEGGGGGGKGGGGRETALPSPPPPPLPTVKPPKPPGGRASFPPALKLSQKQQYNAGFNNYEQGLDTEAESYLGVTFV